MGFPSFCGAATAPTEAFSISKEAADVTVSGSSTGEQTTQDMVEETKNAATVDHNWQLYLSETILGTLDNAVYSSDNTGVATVSQSGYVSRVSNGTTTIRVRTEWAEEIISVTVSRDTNQTSATFARWATGSLAKHITDAVDALLSGVTPTNTTKSLYSSLGVRNSQCWAASLNLTCLSNNAWGGTAITPRHVVAAWHTMSPYDAFPTGTSLSFITTDNQTISRTVSSKARVGTTDLGIIKLNADLPASITIAKVLPATWASYLPNISRGIPAVCLDQEPHVTVADLYFGTSFAFYRQPSNATRASFFEAKVGGDSGKPAFLFINSAPVLLSCWHHATDGPHIASWITETNAVLSSLGGGYSLTEVDLSGFSSF